MYYATLDDGRGVIVDTSREMTRMVGGAEFFLAPAYVNVLLDGSWQTVKKQRLKKAADETPYGGLA